VLADQSKSMFFNLGPHPPRLWPQDVQLLHQLWLDLAAREPGAKLHHRDVVGVALRRMKDQLDSQAGQAVIEDVMQEIAQGNADSETGPTLVDSY
jgi:hypothetical protein